MGQPVDRCPSCSLRLSGPEAQELWHVDQRLAALRQRRTELLALLREPVQTPTQPAPTQSAAAPRWAAQQVLLAVGALLVLVAAIVFLAVAWSAVGVAGQVAVMALLTLAAGAGSVLLARRGLRASREAIAVLAVALAVVDGAAAYRLNLAGLREVNQLGYAAAATAVLALVLVAVTPPVLRHSAVSYRVAAVLAAAAAPLLALAAANAGDPLAATVTCAVVAGLAGWASRRLPGGWAPYRPLLTVMFGCYLVLTWGSGLFALLDQPLLGAGGLAAALALVVAVGAGRAAHLHEGLRPAARAHPLLAGSALLAGGVLVVSLAWQGEVGGLAVLAVVASVIPVLVCLTSDEPEPGLRGVTAASGQLVAVLAVVALTLLVPMGEGPLGAAACAAALAGAGCSAAMLAVIRPSWREPATAWSAATGAAAVGTATAATAAGSSAVGDTLTAAVVVLMVAASRVTVRLEIILLAVAAGTGLIACVLAALAPPLAVGTVGTLPPLALVLTALGLAGLAYGLRPTRDLVAWVGVLLCSAGNAVRLAEAEVTVVEAYSLPLAGLALVVGLIRLRRQPEAPSWLTVGPAVSTGLLPSAFATIGDPALTRPVLVLVVAATVMVLGVRLRWQAPFLSGALAACIVAVTQVAPYAVGAPRWLSFGTVGIVLLVLGFRYEQRRQNASQAVHWVAALR